MGVAIYEHLGPGHGVNGDRGLVGHRARLGKNSAASFPRSSATRASRRRVVGSPSRWSSPTSAAAMAWRMAAVGRVTVSLRRSMGMGRKLAPRAGRKGGRRVAASRQRAAPNAVLPPVRRVRPNKCLDRRLPAASLRLGHLNLGHRHLCRSFRTSTLGRSRSPFLDDVDVRRLDRVVSVLTSTLGVCTWNSFSPVFLHAATAVSAAIARVIAVFRTVGLQLSANAQL